MVDIERPRWLAAITCEIADIDDPSRVRRWRKNDGLQIGQLDSSGDWRYSAADIAELCGFVALRALGFGVGDAIELARRELRPTLRDVLRNRLFFGFWSLSAIELDGDQPFKRTLYLDQIAERVIMKLALPLPVNPLPRTPEIAARMVDAIFDYIESPPGRLRWDKWHEATIARGNRMVPIDQAAAELGAPPWFLRALMHALANNTGGDAIVEKVRPKAPKVRDHLEGVTLQ